MFNRVESLKKVIGQKTLDQDTIGVIIDLHYEKGNITEDENNELLALLYPVVSEPIL